MAKIRKGGPQKKPGDRLKCGKLVKELRQFTDPGPVELRLKREVAAGTRSPESAALVTSSIDILAAAGFHYTALKSASTQRSVIQRNILSRDHVQTIVDFNSAIPARTGTDALDILYARQIIDYDQFQTALDFSACWCALNGRPWPKGWTPIRESPDYNGGLTEISLRRMKIRYTNCRAAMDGVDKALYPFVRDIVVHNKMHGLVSDILKLDVIRDIQPDSSLVYSRKWPGLPPSLHIRLGRLVRGIDIIADAPSGDYTKEADSMIAAMQARESLISLTRP